MLPTDSQKTYRHDITVNFAAGLLLTLLLVNTAFNWKFAHPLVDSHKPVDIIEDGWDMPKTIKLPPEPVTKPEPIKAKTHSLIKIDIISDDTKLSELKAPLIEFDDEPEKIFIPTAVAVPNHALKEEAEPSDYSAAASPKKGLHNFVAYVMKRVSYPARLRDSQTSGTVYVSFIIDEKGQITDVDVTHGLDLFLDEQLVEIITKAPEWIPAYQNGRPVKTRRILPIKFIIR